MKIIFHILVDKATVQNQHLPSQQKLRYEVSGSDFCSEEQLKNVQGRGCGYPSPIEEQR